jgi:hypothetical protein
METILGTAQGGKTRHAVTVDGVLAPTPLADRCTVDAQERIALQLPIQRYRQRW